MAIPSSPNAAQFDPNPACLSYDRGTVGTLLNAVTTTTAQVGNAQPVGANAYGLPFTRSNSDMIDQITLQIDATGTLAGTVTLLGSLDNLNFYSLGTYVVTAATGQEIPNLGIASRYISASFTGATGSGTVTVTFIA